MLRYGFWRVVRGIEVVGCKIAGKSMRFFLYNIGMMKVRCYGIRSRGNGQAL